MIATPTPLPPGVPPVSLPSFSLWHAADDAIAIWNMLPGTAAVQVAVIVCIVALAAWFIIRWLSEISE